MFLNSWASKSRQNTMRPTCSSSHTEQGMRRMSQRFGAVPLPPNFLPYGGNGASLSQIISNKC